jgi:hypothetical protein
VAPTRTEDRAREAARLPVVDLVPNRVRVTVGEVRNHGVARLLARLGGVPAEWTWLLSTDPDTVVPRTWALDHVRHADQGADAVAGLVDPDDPTALSPIALRRYARLIEAGADAGGGHAHAYAANLGVRAASFLRVGGFRWSRTARSTPCWNGCARTGTGSSPRRTSEPAPPPAAGAGRWAGWRTCWTACTSCPHGPPRATENCRYRPAVIRRVKPSGSRWCVTESHIW